MSELYSLPPIQELMAVHNIVPTKALGQHFLLDQNITDKIVRYAAIPANSTVFEIGPGPGGLTRSLLASEAEQIHAIEKDDRCMGLLQAMQDAAGARLSVHHKDALEVSLPAMAAAPRCVVANLPYNVGTALILNWLDDVHVDPSAYHSLTLMVQQEVAERMAAQPYSKAYGKLSILAQWLCDVHIVMEVPPSVFVPPPKVMSAVVQLVPRQARLDMDKAALERITHKAFQQRRKMLRGSLKGLHPNPEAWLEQAGIDPTLRADQLDIAGYGKLANSV